MLAQSLLYSTLLYVLAPVMFVVTAVRGVRDASYRDRLGERFGVTRARFAARPIWVHAVSVGEVQAAATLVRALRARFPECPILMTTATPTGAQRVNALFAQSVIHAYLPYDLRGSVRRFLARVNPRLAIVVEREIWPNLFRECAQRGIPIVLASARLSPKSAWRSRFAAPLVRSAFETNISVGAQTPEDAQRFIALGASSRRTLVTGNIKFDLEVPPTSQLQGELIRAQQFAERPVWIAGSTHEGEEVQVLEAHETVRAAHRNALLILVPRHPNRFEAVKQLLTARQVVFACRSAQQPLDADTSVLLIDTLGELLIFYAAADVAFVAGSLVPIGGHNLLEPAALGLPIVVGPYNFNAPDIAALFLAQRAAALVEDAKQLANAVTALLGDPARCNEMGEHARTLVESNRGAVERTMTLVETRLEPEA